MSLAARGERGAERKVGQPGSRQLGPGGAGRWLIPGDTERKVGPSELQPGARRACWPAWWEAARGDDGETIGAGGVRNSFNSFPFGPSFDDPTEIHRLGRQLSGDVVSGCVDYLGSSRGEAPGGPQRAAGGFMMYPPPRIYNKFSPDRAPPLHVRSISVTITQNAHDTPVARLRSPCVPHLCLSPLFDPSSQNRS